MKYAKEIAAGVLVLVAVGGLAFLSYEDEVTPVPSGLEGMQEDLQDLRAKLDTYHCKTHQTNCKEGILE